MGRCLPDGHPVGRPSRGSPAVVGEGLVGLGHLVGVLALLHSGTEAVGGVEDLVHEALVHGLLATLGRVADEPAERERGATVPLDLDRDLVRRTTDAAGLDLDGRTHVVERTLQRDHRVGAGLLTRALESRVDDALRNLLLAVLKHLGDVFGDQLRPVVRVVGEGTLRGGALAWDVSSSPSWRRSGCEPAYDPSRPGCPERRG